MKQQQIKDILGNYIARQISLEEHLSKDLEAQLAALNEEEFSEVHDLLKGIKVILGKHFIRLNEELDILDASEDSSLQDRRNDASERASTEQIENWTKAVHILRDDYVALNVLAMGNTLLYTAALTVDAKDIANLALEHLANLAPFVHKINNLTPRVLARGLSLEFSGIEPTLGELAASNITKAWQFSPENVSL